MFVNVIDNSTNYSHSGPRGSNRYHPKQILKNYPIFFSLDIGPEIAQNGDPPEGETN